MSTRSPSYPSVDLGEAVRMMLGIFEKEGRTPVKEEVAVTRMGYGGMNGASQKALSSLRKYGLVEDVPGGVKVTQDGIVIAAHKSSPNHPDRKAALRRSAFSVELFSDIFRDFGAAPSEENLAAQLTIKGFSAEGSVRAARAYRATMELVGEVDEGYKPDAPPLSKVTSDADAPPAADLAVGDVVQVQINGVNQLPTPKRVRAIQEHEGQTWVFVEGSDTGIPMQQVILEGKAGQAHPIAPRLVEQKNPAPDTVASDGEREWLRGPLSKEANYRIFVSGNLGPKEIGKLIKLLEAQKAVLSDDDE
jgi:hypothetical protein